MTAKAKKTVDVDVFFTGPDVAELFWQLDGDEQAQFFNAVAGLSGSRLPFQLQFVTDSTHLNVFGRSVMDTIGNYASAKP